MHILEPLEEKLDCHAWVLITKNYFLFGGVPLFNLKMKKKNKKTLTCFSKAQGKAGYINEFKSQEFMKEGTLDATIKTLWTRAVFS